MQNDVTISLSQLLWLIGGITALGAFIKWVSTPFKKIDDHENRISVLEKAETDRKTTDRYTAKALNAIVNFMIDDSSGIDKLKEVRDEYQEQIIEHHI